MRRRPQITPAMMCAACTLMNWRSVSRMLYGDMCRGTSFLQSPLPSGSLILNTLDHSGREKWLPKPLVCSSMCKLAAFAIAQGETGWNWQPLKLPRHCFNSFLNLEQYWACFWILVSNWLRVRSRHCVRDHSLRSYFWRPLPPSHNYLFGRLARCTCSPVLTVLLKSANCEI